VVVAVIVGLGLSSLALSRHLLRAGSRVDPTSLIDPHIAHDRGYAGSGVCLSCHPYQHATWHASYHRSMTQVATPQTILAPFDGIELSLEGVTWRPERRGDTFWVQGRERVPNTDRFAEFERRIVMTTGSHNYQLYWMDSVGGRGMQPFPLVYLLADKVWIPRKSRFLSPPVARTADETGRWSVHCIKCHATAGRPRPPDGETRVADLGIACEACHGPGAEHARRNRDPLRRFRLYLTAGGDPTIVNPARLPHDRATQVCGQCHGIEIFLSPEEAETWRREGSRFRPGDDLSLFQTTVVGRYPDNPPDVRRYIDDHTAFELRNLFWPDGMLRVTGREYHGMLETPCYQRGEMSCLSCHRLHREKDDPRPLPVWADDELGAGMRGDWACLQCHSRYEDPKALSAHSHHPAASSGSRCYNCHMPYTTWGLLRAIRSHTVDSPDVATSVSTGRPNACNQCHLDRTLEWTAGKLQQWYGIQPPDLSEDERTIAASVLWTLSGDPAQRALMAWSMGWEPARRVSDTQWMVPYLCVLLQDRYDAVRYRAQRSLRLYPEYRATVADSVAGATAQQQGAMGDAILTEWYGRFRASGETGGPRFLLSADGAIDQARFTRLVQLRRSYHLVLFE
jgi:hypothetical protein